MTVLWLQCCCCSGSSWKVKTSRQGLDSIRSMKLIWRILFVVGSLSDRWRKCKMGYFCCVVCWMDGGTTGSTAGYLVERYTKMKNVYDFLHPISNPITTYLVGLKMWLIYTDNSWRKSFISNPESDDDPPIFLEVAKGRSEITCDGVPWQTQ